MRFSRHFIFGIYFFPFHTFFSFCHENVLLTKPRLAKELNRKQGAENLLKYEFGSTAIRTNLLV